MSAQEVLVCAGGAVTSAGAGIAPLVEALGDPDWQPHLGLDRPDAPPLPVATCTGFATTGILPPLVARRMDRPARLLAVAARECLQPIGQPRPWSDDRIGVTAGTWTAGTDALVQVLQAVFLSGPEDAPPMQFPSTVANAPASQLGILEHLAGPNLTFYEKQVGGARAVVEACRLLRTRRADAVLACGVDEAQWLNAESYLRLGAMRVGDRPGFILGEGAAVLLLARESERPPLARVLGWGAASSPCTTYLYPDTPDGLAAACQKALVRSSLAPGEIDVVLSLANGMPALAIVERQALEQVLGTHRPAALAIDERLGEGAFAAALRVLVGALALGGVAAPAWTPPSHLAQAGFPPWTGGGRHVLVTALAGGGAALALVVAAP